MGKSTIAEFVENAAVLKALRDIGVDFAQGYGVAKPRPFCVQTPSCDCQVICAQMRVPGA
jgi:EAL domain-containing protein (putative c-di-GMP-specific phosphodiesterase class I)